MPFFALFRGRINIELLAPRLSSLWAFSPFSLQAVGKFDWDELCVILAQFHREVGTRTDLRERTVQGVTVTGFDGVLDAEDVPAAWRKRAQCTLSCAQPRPGSRCCIAGWA